MKLYLDPDAETAAKAAVSHLKATGSGDGYVEVPDTVDALYVLRDHPDLISDVPFGSVEEDIELPAES